jgi:hypothetical protein
VNASYALLVFAFVCFVLAGVGAAIPRVHIGWIGLALWVGSQVFF